MDRHGDALDAETAAAGKLVSLLRAAGLRGATCDGTQFIDASPDVVTGSIEHLVDNRDPTAAVLMVPVAAIH